MTRDEYDQLDSNGQVACPDCGERNTHPYPGCGCPARDQGGWKGTRHINKWHHTCIIHNPILKYKGDCIGHWYECSPKQRGDCTQSMSCHKLSLTVEMDKRSYDFREQSEKYLEAVEEQSEKYLEAVEKENKRKYEARQMRHIILD